MKIPDFSVAGRPGPVGVCRVTETVALADGSVGVVRVEDFFTEETAAALHRFLAETVVYERDEIGATKRANRAARDGDLPDSPISCRPGDAGTERLAREALAVFRSEWFLGQLSDWLGDPIEVLRPSTPYRLDPADYVDPHDDYPAPEYRLSVACNMTPSGGAGGETVVGLIASVEEYEDDAFFFPLKKWNLEAGERSLSPIFNSLLLIPLSPTHAHAVRKVADVPRYSVTTIYGKAVS